MNPGAPPTQALSLAGKLFMLNSPKPHLGGCGEIWKNSVIVYAFGRSLSLSFIHSSIH